MQARTSLPWWPGVVVLVAVSIMAAWVVNEARPVKLPWWSDFRAEKAAQTQRKGFLTVAPAEARAMLVAGARLFVDAREPAEYEAGHIPGAVSVSAEALLTGMDSVLPGVEKGRPLLVYCGDLACPKSRDLAQGLKELGFADIAVMPEGLDGWRAAGGPVEAK
ncbi:Thiosulfate sulfurtransferase GlpE [Fundidesulfovibrio magnetotacticus]|uniref:Thiosulfate sulfurtransferase GlpE n=1 Tax=Fundidesulfovibrio magnetotacticus TaxID=2730080 RepID=A0A6V8LRT3_9BACT|nr:rhodanese-like domain-containing protein [Fundidesulfovibrio magnetotacticus]GFK92496.1 Thiosulfate sulfurtransferase GlpE [Fundidesulfovibrio magnetotacticus]